MNMLDKYVAEVGKHLPRRNRADIEAEIRSTLEDMLEERTAGREASEAEIVALLKEYGAPRQVAASYGAVQYLIGPRLFPIFTLVLKIVFSVLGMVALLGFSFSAVRNGMNGAEMSAALAETGLQFIGTIFSAFGNIVLVFTILERTLPASALDKAEQPWNPADLNKAPDPDRLDYPHLVAEIVFTLMFVVVLNRFSQAVGFGFMEQGKWVFISVLSPAFFQYLPWINLISMLTVLLDVWLLRTGSWQRPTRLVNLALQLGSIVLALFMLAGPSILAVSSEQLPESLAKLEKLETLLSFVVIPILLSIILAGGIDAIKSIRRLVDHRPAAPFGVRK